MFTYSLAETRTKDGLIHQGLYFEPKKKTTVAILWVHGLSGTFYNNVELFAAFVDRCQKQGWGFASFNTRGHDAITGIRKVDPSKDTGYGHIAGGAGQEIFEDCIYDIDAGISYLVDQGYTEVIVVGHSTGANKACYYAGTKKDRRVKAVVLTGPMSDRLSAKLSWYARLIVRVCLLLRMKRILLSGLGFFPMTPQRFISLYSPNTAEDVFDYGDPSPRMTTYAKITQPLLVIFGELDEHADRPIGDIQKVFDRYETSQTYKSVIIRNALHSFGGGEKLLVSEIEKFILSL